jgi:hypothetical protein
VVDVFKGFSALTLMVVSTPTDGSKSGKLLKVKVFMINNDFPG